MKILIVEDEYTSRMIIKSSLEKYGTCSIKANGTDTLKTIREAYQKNEPFDLICMDINLPDINGLKLVEKIRTIEINKDIPVEKQTKIFIITGHANKDAIKEASELKCNEFIVKPISEQKLKECIEKHGIMKSPAK